MSQKWSRRRFLAGLGAPGILLAAPGGARLLASGGGAATLEEAGERQAPAAEPEPRLCGPPGGPLAIATWNHGRAAVEVAGSLLERGASPLEAVEKGVNAVEDDAGVDGVGIGGLPNEEGTVELDAAVMHGRSLQAGAVGSLRGIRNAISVARRVMERTHHVLLVGEGARRFALAQGFREEDLLTDSSRRRWEEWKRDPRRRTFWRDSGAEPGTHDTVSLLVLDRAGGLGAGVSTSGLAWKLPGRVGDSPIVGCGLYADDEVGAAAATGIGEAIIRSAGSHAVVEAMRRGLSPREACEEVVRRILRRDPGRERRVAFIALGRSGELGAATSDPEFSYALYRDRQVTLTPVPAQRA